MNTQQSVPMRNEIPEKLMEELRRGLCKACECAVIDGDTGELFDDCETNNKESCAKLALQNINRIRQAIESGELPLANEVGRADFHMKTRQDIESWVDDMLEKDASAFIALCVP